MSLYYHPSLRFAVVEFEEESTVKKILGSVSVFQYFLIYRIFTVRNEVAKVMFLQVSVCPQRGGAWSRGGSAPGWGVGIPACTEADPPPPPGETATAADGTHPTGMHSYYIEIYTCVECLWKECTQALRVYGKYKFVFRNMRLFRMLVGTD